MLYIVCAVGVIGSVDLSPPFPSPSLFFFFLDALHLKSHFWKWGS